MHSPDAKTLVSASERTIKLWNVTTGEEESTLKLERSVRGIALSPDGKTLATGGDGPKIRLWEMPIR
jgi:WD40 repeat protein